MKNIPIRHINKDQNEPKLSENFRIRDVRNILAGKDMTQDMHRHDFFFILAIQKGIGSHEMDFISYEVNDGSVFFLRPGSYQF